MYMRIDKYLKVSRLIIRRTIANELCNNGKVLINNKVAKPSTEVKENDVITLILGNKKITTKVLKLLPYAKKKDADDMYQIISSDEIKS